MMEQIEPDLLLKNIPLLDAKYAGETPDQKEARMKRYEEAYKKFDRKFSDLKLAIQVRAHETNKKALKEQEGKAKTEDVSALKNLEEGIGKC